ncbi:hypothetical protein RRG08_042890 [Elysia crispata]|uniref:AAA+ ATPase domain-containing protein n=1 Tax=Elysia crispata TaxID=231223 RepID=A0AAE1AVF7_9GAST|nr:hypothetical protein RRG08_042890 [Elysia crispata]
MSVLPSGVASETATNGNAPRKRLWNFANDDRLKIHGTNQWYQANHEAEVLLCREPPVDASGEPVMFKPIEGLEQAYEFLAVRYVEYVLLLQMMTSSLKRLLHPQKRLLLKRFIEAVACRVCELKSEMTKLSSSHIHNLHGYYHASGITPDQLQYGIPESIIENLQPVLKLREMALSLTWKTLEGRTGQDPSDTLAFTAGKDTDRTEFFSYFTIEPASPGLSRDQAEFKDNRSSKIYSSFSATLGKMRPSSSEGSGGGLLPGTRRRTTEIGGSVVLAKADLSKNISGKQLVDDDFVESIRFKEMISDSDFHMKVKFLLRYWRKWICRQEFQITKETTDGFYGMSSTTNLAQAKNPIETKAAAEQTLRRARDELYVLSLKPLREQYMSSSEASFDIWALKLNLEQWILELRDLLGKCPPYPPEEAGGCLALFSDKTVDQVMEELEEFDEKEKTKKSDKEKEKEKEKKKKENPKEKAKTDKDAGFLWTMPRSLSVPVMCRALDQYVQYWNLKLELDNLEQGMDLQLAKETVRAEAEETIRKMVDAMMLVELDKLRAIDREPAPKPDKKDKKKDKGAKKRKKDPLAHRSVEEIFGELALTGIVAKPEQVTLDDFIGAPNLLDSRYDVYRPATPQDLKMVLREVFGLPLCSPLIHSSVDLRNSVLLAGPPGAGKTMMVSGLCKETGATVFDLSPVRMVGKFVGKKREDYLMSLLQKVAKAMEPSIILVDECHLLFPSKKAKKRPDVSHDKPTRWVRLLSRLMKKFVQGDRVLLVGVTNEPFLAKTGAMCKLFQNAIFVPFPEYGSRWAIWLHFLKNVKLLKAHEINVSSMAKLSEGLTGGDIKTVISTVCTASRLTSNRRLRGAEMVPAIARKLADDRAPTRADWVKWYLTTPMMKARQEMIKSITEKDSEEAAAGKSGKKK